MMSRTPSVCVLAVAMLACADPAAAQSLKKLNDRNASRLSGSQAEVSIAANPAKPKQVIAASMSVNTPERGILVMASRNRGRKWNQTMIPNPEGPGLSADPMVAFNGRGTAFLAYIPVFPNSGTRAGLDLHRSSDGGNSWSGPVRVSDHPNTDKIALAASPATSGRYAGHVYLTWKWPAFGVYFSRSRDGGLTFSRERRIADRLASGPAITTDGEGRVFIAYNNPNSSAIEFLKSTNAGQSFSAPIRVAGTRGSFYTITPSHCRRHSIIYASIAVDRSGLQTAGNLYVSWSDSPPNADVSGAGDPCDPGFAGTADVYVSRSTDGGQTWSEPVTVHDSSLGNADQYHQWLDLDQKTGAVFVAYKDTRDDPSRQRTHVYLSASFDGGATWGSDLRMSDKRTDAPNGFQYGDYQGLAIGSKGKLVYSAWADFRTGAESEIFVGRVRVRK